jgi:hypothetical protein
MACFTCSCISSRRSARACGPMSVPGCMGSPTFTACIAAVNLARKASYTGDSTMKRLAQMQLWPALMVRATAPTFAACSRSASASTMNGSEPPSSITEGFNASPAAAATARPAGSLPVIVAAAMRGSRMIPRTGFDPTSSVRKRSGGNPASCISFSMASAHWGTLEACLSNPPFPAMRCGAMNRNTCQ